MCIGTLTLRIRALSVFRPIGAIRRAASCEKNAFHCRHRKNYYPCPSEKQDTKSGNVERVKSGEGPFDDVCGWESTCTVRHFFNACHYGHDPQSHALCTRGPCIPIGHFQGLVYCFSMLCLPKKAGRTEFRTIV